MGLDVYLYTRAQQEASDAHDAASEAFWEREDWSSEEEKQAAEKAIPPYVGYTDVPSERYPDHLFNRRYLRSSYNGGGFNGAVPTMTGTDHGLYWIFEPVRGNTDEYSFELTEASIGVLEQAKARALQVAEELRSCDGLMTGDASTMLGHMDHLWSDLPSEDQVLDWYRDERKKSEGRAHPFGESYSCAKGTVLGLAEGLEVLAVTLGKDCLGRPAAIYVFRSKALDSYIQSAEITAEFCDEAIALIRQDGSACIHWSG